MTVYLDHAATTPLRPAAVAAIGEVVEAPHGNPSGAHRVAQRSLRLLDEALHAEPNSPSLLYVRASAWALKGQALARAYRQRTDAGSCCRARSRS